MTYESGYEIVVGVRLIPSQTPVDRVGSVGLPRSEAPRKKDKVYSSIFRTESRRTPSQRRAFQELLEVVQPFDSPSTLRQACPEHGRRAQDSAGIRTPPVKPFEPEMALVPAGEFTMGSDPSLDPDAVKQPQHTLYLPSYYLAKTPVTNAQYAAFVQATGHRLPERWAGSQPPTGKENHPVVYVSWHDAMAYCAWLAEETGKHYRLPSEAEWEKGARGSQGDEKRYNATGGKRSATSVGTCSQGAIPYELLDMSGNVWEWTLGAERYSRGDSEVYSYDPGNGQKHIKSGVGRVLRGGSWYRNQWYARCTLRYGVCPDARYHYIGFRVAASPLSLPTLEGDHSPYGLGQDK